MQKLIYKIVARFTELFPWVGAALIDWVFFAIVGNALVGRAVLLFNRRRLKRVKKFERICILGDVNIGDAVNLQSAVAALRVFFPAVRIDYVIKKGVDILVGGNPKISNLFPIYTGVPYPNNEDLTAINQLLDNADYDLIFNFCPFIPVGKLRKGRAVVVNYRSLVISVIRGEARTKDKSHVVYRTYKFVCDLFSGADGKSGFKGNSIRLSAEAVKQAGDFLESHGLLDNRPLVFLNPNTSSPFTKIPDKIQVALLEKLVDLRCSVLLGTGPLQEEANNPVIQALPIEKRRKITIVPFFPLDVYAALVDFCGVYLTGDTGTAHIAAARKVAKFGNFKLRNRTAVFSIFGATSPRMYGYDSQTAGFFAANQNAYSRTFFARNPYRNILYANKFLIASAPEKFFKNLNLEEIIAGVRSLI